MDLYKALLITFAILAACELSEGWRVRIRLRRAWEAIKKPVCKVVCTKVCHTATTAAGGAVGGPVGAGVGATVGSLVCKLPCNKHCKRSISDELMNGTSVIVPMDPDFEDYDLDEDKCISLKELSMVIGVQEWDADEAFKQADMDDDECLDHEEFETAPWLFHKKSGAVVPWHSTFNNGKSDSDKPNNGKPDSENGRSNRVKSNNGTSDTATAHPE